MSSEKVKLSVCITAYNVGKYLQAAIDSVLAQKTNFRFEILIGEDGSTDNTKSIIERNYKQYPDLIVPFYNPQNRGYNYNLVNLVVHAKGEYVVQFDGDDIMKSPYRLQLMADFLDTHPQHTVCISNYETIDENGNVKIEDAYGKDYVHRESEHFLYKTTGGGMGVIRKSALPDPLPEWIYQSGGAIDFALYMIASANHLVGYIPEIVTSYRKHTSSMTVSAAREGVLERNIFLCKRFREYYTPIDKKYDAIFKSGASYYGYILSYLKLSKGKVFGFLYYFIRAFINWPVLSAQKHKDYLFMASPELFYKIKSLFGRGK